MTESVNVDVKPQRVANLLKQLINQNCVDGWKWFEDIGEMPTVSDILKAIEMLEKVESEHFEVVFKE